jgi:hypothetical protein
VLVSQLGDPGRDLTVARLELAEDVHLPGDVLEAAAVNEPERFRIADATPHRLPADLTHTLANHCQERRADPAPARLRVYPDHGERAACDARRPHERGAAALVQEADAVSARGLLGGQDAVGLDRVVDLGAALEVRAGLGDANHPDRFSFPCFLA